MSKRWTLFIILVLIILIMPTLIGILFWRWYAVDVKAVPIEVTLTNTTLIGFNAGTDKLYFGTVGPGGVSERKTTAVTSYNAIVVVSVEGQVAPWVSVSENHIKLSPNERHDITFRLTAPATAVPGNYTGTAIVHYYRALPWQ